MPLSYWFPGVCRHSWTSRQVRGQTLKDLPWNWGDSEAKGRLVVSHRQCRQHLRQGEWPGAPLSSKLVLVYLFISGGVTLVLEVDGELSGTCLCRAGGQRLCCETLEVWRRPGRGGGRLRLRIPQRYQQPFLIPQMGHLSSNIKNPTKRNESPAGILLSVFSDPKTKAWLLRYLDPVFGYPQLVRFSWSTAQTLMDSKGVTVHW